MNRFYIEKLVVSGGGHKNSVVEFKKGFNLIIGPSNTGKSLVTDCIDYAFGFQARKNHPSKIVENNNGYDTVTLHLRTNGGTVVLERKIPDTKIKVSGTDPAVEHDTYSIGHTAKKNINSVFLQLLGITDEHRILSSEDGATNKLTWRSMLHLFLMRQGDVARESSALTAPGGQGKTASPAVLLFLLTGRDANDIEKPEDPEISKAKLKALTEYIRDKAERFSSKRAELEERLAQTNGTDIQTTIEKIQADIDSLQEKLDTATAESQQIMTEIYTQNGKLSECNTVIHNFSILHRQYQSDIRRIEFVVEGRSLLPAKQSSRHCPFCNSEVTVEPPPVYIDASLAELEKIKVHLVELDEAQRNMERRKASIVERIRALETRKSEVDTLVADKLRPQLSAFHNELEAKMQVVRLSGELEAVKQNEIQYRSELFEKENTEIPDKPKHNIFNQYEYDLVHGFETKLIEVLKSSNVGGALTARLSMTNFDIEIDGITKSASMGGGFCGLLNAITVYAMSNYIIETGGRAPGFFIVDSALTQLSEAEHIPQNDTIKRNFIQYLITHATSQQLIMVEQKKRMPFIPEESDDESIHVVEFSRDKAHGQYGFLNDVFNPEDKEG